MRLLRLEMINEKTFQKNLEKILKLMYQVERTAEKHKTDKNYSDDASSNYRLENRYCNTIKNKYKNKHIM